MCWMIDDLEVSDKIITPDDLLIKLSSGWKSHPNEWSERELLYVPTWLYCICAHTQTFELLLTGPEDTYALPNLILIFV